MTVCTKCQIDKPEDAFAWKNKATGRRSPACRACHNTYSKKHYQNNKIEHLEKATTHNVGYKERNRRWLLDYLTFHPCVDCGEPDVDILQFDHIEMVGQNAPRVGAYINCSLARMQEEVEKCEVRCANCHFRRTREQMGWLRTI